MRSTFGSLETGLRALRTNQLALQVTGQNISNADTPGYSRQVPVITTTEPYTYPSLNRYCGAGQIGTGVEVTDIIRMRESFIDAQIQSETSLKGKWEARQNILEHVEVIFGEPSDSGISARLNQFWDSLHELAYHSEDSSVRAAVREAAVVFTDSVNHSYTQLMELKQDIDQKISTLVSKVNSLAQQIAGLNEVISKIKGLGQSPNDFMDQRELLVQELSGLVNINVYVDEYSRYNICIGGSSLVSREVASQMRVERNMANQGMLDLKWEQTNADVILTSGQIKGLIEMRDEDVEFYIDSLNEFASSLITNFNSVHELGFGLLDSTNIPFFSGTDARTIGVSYEVMSDLNAIAASIDVAVPPELPHGAPGNGENAINLTRVISSNYIMNGNTMTITQYYNGIIAKLGIDAEKANSTSANQETLIEYLSDRQEAVAGVSLDEEMANMIKYQNAYNAASRYFTTIDELLDVLIKGTGVVGR